MLKIKENCIVYNFSQCQQCGVCEAVCPKFAITMKRLANGLHEVLVDDDKCIKCLKCVKCCPANKGMGKNDYLKNLPNKEYFLGYNKNNAIRRMCSSGGVCKTLIINGLRNRLVDGVYTLKKLENYPSGEGEFYTQENIPDYEDLANSVYHSVMIGTNIHKVRKCERLMIVGTSCQLRALEIALKGKYKEIIKVCIFCKQQKTLESTRFLAKVMGYEISENLKFSTRYRGDGWPGIVRVGEAELPYSRAAQLPFGRRLWTVPGCDVCSDPFGMECEADITLMDPWIIRKENEMGETLITVHTERGMFFLNSCQDVVIEKRPYVEIKSALGLSDVLRKRALIPYFRGETDDKRIIRAGKAEQRQRCLLSTLAMNLPKLPFICYRVMAHFPDLRNKILKYKDEC